MKNFYPYQKRKFLVIVAFFLSFLVFLCFRLGYIMIGRGAYYGMHAKEIQQRERRIKAARGEILDRNGEVIAANKSVCTISVIRSQINNPEEVIHKLSEALGYDEEIIRKRVEKKTMRERIASNVEKSIGDQIRSYGLAGVKVDEDYIRIYPYSEMASKVLGFTGSDNQGIIGLEVSYDSILQGQDGRILTITDSHGIEQEEMAEERIEPIMGDSLRLTIDCNIQQYAQQLAERTKEVKEANYVSIIVMNPKDGSIFAMVNAPEFDLNHPFDLIEEFDAEDSQTALNKMWRNNCISDTYEPGSTFKIITATAALSLNKVTVDSMFSCPGYCVVEDRRIRCHKVTGHGSQTFLQGIQNSCNPTFVAIGERVGVDGLFDYMKLLGLRERTGVDVPGEANSIVHKKEVVGPVELATMSFGQSFQITPLQLLRAVSAVINGGYLITPHFAEAVIDSVTKKERLLEFEKKETTLSKNVCEQMKEALYSVVAVGGGSKGQVEGYAVGGKTATSQKLPRSAGKYIASYIGFAPAYDPSVIAMVIIDEPKGMYYGGQIAAPVISELFEVILPYLEVEKQ